jgi:hypothetical protein
MTHRIFPFAAAIIIAVCVLPARVRAQKGGLQQASSARQRLAAMDYQAASAKRMFILVSDGHAISAISVDTTHIEDLRAALKLQELVFRISGIRMRLVDDEFVKVPWGMIHIKWDHFPATGKRPFEISMQEIDPTNYNPAKQVIIAGSGDGDIESAVSAFTEATLGIPLDALEDKEYKWEHAKTVAIPEKMEPILGSYK